MLRSAVIVALALLLAPTLVVAQATEPVGIVSDDETTVSRAYDNPAAVNDELSGLFALGFVNGTESEASGMVERFPAILGSSITSEMDASVEVGEAVSVPVTLGDEASGNRIPLSMLGMEGEYTVLVVRQGTWVQALVGFGVGDVDTLTDLEGISRTTLARWPSEAPVAVRADGLRAGGIWSMMPMPEDLPAWFEIDPEFEEGPAATSAAVAPAPSGPAATPASPSRDLPLLPTPTPAGGEAQAPIETPVPPVTATETPAPSNAPAETPAPAEVATPAPNPRLAQPFDVTVEIFLPLDMATMNDDGTCSGAGLLDGLTGDGSLTLQDSSGGGASVSAPLDAPGQVAFDRETSQEICYFRATLTEVPPRAEYTLLAGDSVLRQYSYDDLADAGSVLVVIGED
jgi:hypothetical protein